MALATVAPIAVRRHWPTLVGAGVPALAAVDHAFLDPRFVGYPIANFCAMYALAAWTRPRGFAVGVAVFVAVNIAVAGSVSRVGLSYALISIAAMLLVRNVVVGRERRAELAERERELYRRSGKWMRSCFARAFEVSVHKWHCVMRRCRKRLRIWSLKKRPFAKAFWNAA